MKIKLRHIPMTLVGFALLTWDALPTVKPEHHKIAGILASLGGISLAVGAGVLGATGHSWPAALPLTLAFPTLYWGLLKLKL